ncbi:MAG: protein-L-isoaspartate(D-aspartate) O-methyltransferase [Anaerolineae bacterium]
MRRCVLILLLTLTLGAPACAPRPAVLEPVPTPDNTTAPDLLTRQPSPEAATAAISPTADPYLAKRKRMVDMQMRQRDITDERVLAAMERVPRHEFVLPETLDQAYNDYPLPIGYGQTISQPYIVALMTQMLDLQPGEKVLEIGTGSGYQAAVLAELTDKVYTIEIIPELAERARQTLDRLGYVDVVSTQGDGYWGWEEYAPFDAIIVTAAPDHIPQPLLYQLADGGHMVIPVGPPGGYQSLWLISREGDEFHNFNWGGVRFVPLTRAEE